MIHVQFSTLLLEVVERCATGIHFIEFECWGKPSFSGHLQGHPGFQRTAGAHGVANMPLEGTDGHGRPKNAICCFRFGNVPHFGGRAVRVALFARA